MSHCAACAKSGEPCRKHDRIVDDLEILDQYETVLHVLRELPVRQGKEKRLRGERRRMDEPFGHWVDRLMPLARKAWESFAWRLRDPEKAVPSAPAAYGKARSPTAEELEAFMRRPLVIYPIPLSDDRLRVLVTRVVSRSARRRDAIRSRLAYALLAERWNSSPTVIRSRIEAARKLETELEST